MVALSFINGFNGKFNGTLDFLEKVCLVYFIEKLETPATDYKSL